MNRQHDPSEELRSAGLTLITIYVDEFGREHTARHTLPVSEEVFDQIGVKWRRAAERFYADLGYVLISLQKECSQSEVMFERPISQARCSGPLRLVVDNTRRRAA